MKKIGLILLVAICVFASVVLCSCGKCKHKEYGEYTVAKAPTCTEAGISRRACLKCGNTEEKDIPATGHQFENNVCTVCGAAEDPTIPESFGDLLPAAEGEFDLTLSVPNAEETVALAAMVKTLGGATVTVSLDEEGKQPVEGETVSPAPGHNTYYLSIRAGEAVRVYSVDLYRGVLYTCRFTVSDSNFDVKYVEEGHELTRPEDPERAGYRFLGWKLDGEDATFPFVPTADTEIVAEWDTIVYTIHYELSDGTNAEANPATYTVEDTVTLADPTKTGYAFAGWTEGNGIAAGSTGEKTFTAVWTMENYTIHYELSGGTNAEANPATYTIADAVTLADPTRTGYTFYGWEEGFGITAGSTGEKTFTAVWTPIKYTITYFLDDGINVSENPATYTIEDEITLLDATGYSGHAFIGWFAEAKDIPNNPLTKIGKGTTGALALIGRWEVGTPGLKYRKNDDGYAVSGYTGTDANVVIPDTHLGLPVTAIDGSAFRSNHCNSTVKTVIMGDSIRVIGDLAFDGCWALESITFSVSLATIEGGAFRGCWGLKSLTFPDALLTIADTAFRSCTGIETISFGAGLKSIGEMAFDGCSSIQSLNFPAKLTSIGGTAFRSCNSLTAVVFAGPIESIPETAFDGCDNLESVTVPAGLKFIGGMAFRDCYALTTVNFGGTKSEWVAVSKGGSWKRGVGEIAVVCSDGNYTE